MKVLLINPYLFMGGAEKSLLYLAYYLTKWGHDVDICSLTVDMNNLPEKFRYLDIFTLSPEINYKHLKNSYDVTLLYSSEFIMLRKLVRYVNNEHDIIVPFNFPAYWVAASLQNKTPKLWYCSEVLGPYDRTKRLYEKSSLFKTIMRSVILIDKFIVRKGIHRIATCSELNRKLILNRYRRPAYVIPTGVDYEFLAAPPSNLNKLDSDLILLHVGSFTKRKNQITSIRSLKIIKKRVPSAKLILVGEGPDEPILRREVRMLDLEDSVIFMGKVSEDTLKGLYYMADINLFPVIDQTFGLVPFEALVAGTISIVSKHAGAAQLIKKYAILAEPNVLDLAEAIMHVYENGDAYKSMIENGRKWVKENLTWEKYARSMEKLMVKTIESFP